jgi:ArsR family transcriptional regulator
MSLEPTIATGIDFAAAAELLKAHGHPLRLRIVALLAAGREHVGAIAERLAVPPAIASQQLRLLRMAGVVAATRENGLVVYRITDPRVIQLLHCMEACP